MASPRSSVVNLEVARRKIIADGIMTTVPVIDEMMKSSSPAEPHMLGGGRAVVSIGAVDDPAFISSSTTGDGQLNLTQKNMFIKASYDWAEAAIPLIITKFDLLQNQAPSAIVKQEEEMLRRAMNQTLQALNQRVIANASAATYGFAGLATLNGSDAGGGGLTTAILRPAAFGTQTGVCGGVNRATYTRGWQNQFADAADDFSANGRRAMNTLVGQCRRFSDNRGKNLRWFMQEAYYNYLDITQAQEQYGQVPVDGKVQTSAMAPLHSGIPIFYEPDLATSATADEEVSGYLLDLDHISLCWPKGGWLAIGEKTDMIAAEQSAIGRELYTTCALTASKLTSSGVLVDGETA